jgi:hypothetical protein
MSDRITKERINRRIAELREAEREAVARVIAIRQGIAELEALLEPEVITTSGEQEA